MAAADAQNGFSGISKSLGQSQFRLISGRVDAFGALIGLTEECGVQVVTAGKQKTVAGKIGRRAITTNGDASGT